MVLSELRGIGAGTTEGTPYVLWGWNPVPQKATTMQSGRSAVVGLVRVWCTLFGSKCCHAKVYDERLLRRVALEAVKSMWDACLAGTNCSERTLLSVDKGRKSFCV